MPDQLPPHASDPPPAVTCAGTDWHRPMLRELAEMAMDGARRARTEARRHNQRRAEIRRRLTQTIRESADPSDAEALLADLDDRLDDADIHAALDHTPAFRIVIDLCAEWGIRPNLATWTDEELQAAAETPPLPP